MMLRKTAGTAAKIFSASAASMRPQHDAAENVEHEQNQHPGVDVLQ